MALALAAAASQAAAHGSGTPGTLPWHGEPWVVVLLALSVIGYGIGLTRLWRHAHGGAGVTRAEAGAFAAGWIILALTLCSPLDGLGADLFAAHMVQHELLMVVAAPLLVLGRPLATWAWALPTRMRPQVGAWTRHRAVSTPWRVITRPLGAFTIHAAALWIWHLPLLFQGALANEAVHALQHTSFLFSALLFWWAMFRPGNARMHDGVAVLYLFATMLHTGALGALLALSNAPWYTTDAVRTAVWGLSPLEDQQLGGLIMWIPAGTVYVIAGVWLMARWLAASAARAASPLQQLR